MVQFVRRSGAYVRLVGRSFSSAYMVGDSCLVHRAHMKADRPTAWLLHFVNILLVVPLSIVHFERTGLWHNLLVRQPGLLPQCYWRYSLGSSHDAGLVFPSSAVVHFIPRHHIECWSDHGAIRVVAEPATTWS